MFLSRPRRFGKSLLTSTLHSYWVKPSEIGRKTAVAEDFDAPTETMTGILPLLYQSGYITIKDYDEELDLYTLDIPNKEVRIGLMKSPYSSRPCGYGASYEDRIVCDGTEIG